MKRFILLIATILLLAGCSNIPGLENRMSCTLAGDKALFVSQYGPLGISSTVADQDRAAVCRKPAGP
jgi:hypothetical protein